MAPATYSASRLVEAASAARVAAEPEPEPERGPERGRGRGRGRLRDGSYRYCTICGEPALVDHARLGDLKLEAISYPTGTRGQREIRAGHKECIRRLKDECGEKRLLHHLTDIS